MLLMKDRSILYELRAYLIYAKVGERSFLYELRSYLIHAKVGEMAVHLAWFFTRNGDSRFLHGFTRISRLIRKPESIYAVSNVFEWRHIFVGLVERL